VLQVKCQIELPRQAVTLQTVLEVETMNTGLVLNAQVRKLKQRESLGDQSWPAQHDLSVCLGQNSRTQ